MPRLSSANGVIGLIGYSQVLTDIQMMTRRNSCPTIAAIAMILACTASVASAQTPVDPRGIPIPTTVVLSKPAPGETYGDRLLITVGVGTVTYKFVLKDGYTNHIYVKWSNIWEQVRQYSPNLVAQGLDSEKFGQIEPGTTVTVSGMYTAQQRTFEIMTMEPGENRFRGAHQSGEFRE